MATRFLIEGTVQGVGYRSWCRAEARARGLKGYVRNRWDGRVEAVVIGAHDTVDAMLKACREGPPSADVTAIRLDAVEPPPIDGFVILQDA